jgi:hypothetical protein
MAARAGFVDTLSPIIRGIVAYPGVDPATRIVI